MGRFRGEVEQARRDLVEMGFTPREARDRAPHLADLRQGEQDQTTRPYAWLGAPAAEADEHQDGDR